MYTCHILCLYDTTPRDIFSPILTAIKQPYISNSSTLLTQPTEQMQMEHSDHDSHCIRAHILVYVSHHCYNMNMEHHCTLRPTKLPFMKLPFSQKSTFYQACQMALPLPTFFKRDHIRYLGNHLSHLILCWLHHCGAYNANVKFIHQQKRIIQFICSSPPPPYYPTQVVIYYLSILSSRIKTNTSYSNYKYFQKKKHTLHAVTPDPKSATNPVISTNFHPPDSNCEDIQFPSNDSGLPYPTNNFHYSTNCYRSYQSNTKSNTESNPVQHSATNPVQPTTPSNLISHLYPIYSPTPTTPATPTTPNGLPTPTQTPTQTPINTFLTIPTTLFIPTELDVPPPPLGKRCPLNCPPPYCNNSCLVCIFFNYHHPSPICQWSSSRSFRSKQQDYLPEYNSQFVFHFNCDNNNKILCKDVEVTELFFPAMKNLNCLTKNHPLLPLSNLLCLMTLRTNPINPRERVL
jgi:hypothetical protein